MSHEPIKVCIQQIGRNNIAEATKGNRTLIIQKVDGLTFATATINRGEYVETVNHHKDEWKPFFIAIHNARN